MAQIPGESSKTSTPLARDQRQERRATTARETVQTLPEVAPSEIDFEAHDTIPAPPWLDDEISPAPPRQSP